MHLNKITIFRWENYRVIDCNVSKYSPTKVDRAFTAIGPRESSERTADEEGQEDHETHRWRSGNFQGMSKHVMENSEKVRMDLQTLEGTFVVVVEKWEDTTGKTVVNLFRLIQSNTTAKNSLCQCIVVGIFWSYLLCLSKSENFPLNTIITQFNWTVSISLASCITSRQLEFYLNFLLNPVLVYLLFLDCVPHFAAYYCSCKWKWDPRRSRMIFEIDRGLPRVINKVLYEVL